jgi:hypothetical protein
MNQYNPLESQKDKDLIHRILQNNKGSTDPIKQLVEDFKQDIEQRIDNAAVFYPLSEILSRREPDNPVFKIIPELCFLFLTHLIYIGRSNHRGVSFEELTEFVRDKAVPVLELNISQEDEIKELTNKTLDALQNNGHNYSFLTHRFSKSGDAWKYVKFVEIRQSDEGELLYFITDQGIDFYLKTKEFPEEAKITINLLLFQKQMEKGTYIFAYETVQRLNMAVRQKQDQRYTILTSLQNGQMESYDRYIAYHREIIDQSREEKELFDVSKANIESAQDDFFQRIQRNEASQLDEDNYQFLQIIEGELSRAIDLHTDLLRNAVEFMNDFDKELNLQSEMLFAERFDFHTTFTQLTQNSTPDTLKYVFEPLLKSRTEKRFNLANVFLPQRKTAKHNTKDIIEAGVIDDTPILDLSIINQVNENFLVYSMHLLVSLLNKEREMTLSEWFDVIEDQFGLDRIYTGDLISYILKLADGKKSEHDHHRRQIAISKKVVINEDKVPSIEHFLFEARAVLAQKQPSVLDFEYLLVTSLPDKPEIESIKGLKITDMQFMLTERIR